MDARATDNLSDTGPVAPGDCTVLRAGPGDLTLALEAVRHVNLRAPADEDTLAAFLADRSRYLLIALIDGRVVGSLTGYALTAPHRPEPQFLLYDINVLPDHQGRGAGRSLVRRFIAEARTCRAFEVWVLTDEANPAALQMYTSCGLTRERRGEVMLNLLFSHE